MHIYKIFMCINYDAFDFVELFSHIPVLPIKYLNQVFIVLYSKVTGF